MIFNHNNNNDYVMWMGMVFHLKGAATEKALSPAHLLLLGTRRLKPWFQY